MENILDIVEEPGPGIKESNILKYLWFHPTACFKYILKHMPEKHVNLLFVLGGFTNGISRASERNFLDQLDFWAVVLLSGLFGALAGWVVYYILAWAIHETGKWLKAKGKTEEIRTVLAWSMVPNILAFAIVIAQYALFGAELFSAEFEVENVAYSIAMMVFGVLATVLYIWSLVILVRGVALVHGFSAGRAFVNILIPYLIIIVAVATVALLYFTLKG
jgi:hypothetical protein